MTNLTADFAFASEREAATKIRAAAKAAGVTLHPLPYSRFDPDKTTWWLSPTTTNPAYAFGKVVVERPTIVDDGAKLVGLHVEKGVGDAAAPIFEDTARGRRLVMRRDWIWHPFVRALRSGAMDDSVQAAEAAADGLPLVVEVVASMQYPPRLEDVEDRPVDPDAVERVRYQSDAGTLRLLARRTPAKLQRLEDHESMQSIGDKLASIEDGDWTWLEVLIGVPFRPIEHGGLAATEVWQRVCAPWSAWIR